MFSTGKLAYHYDATQLYLEVVWLESNKATPTTITACCTTSSLLQHAGTINATLRSPTLQMHIMMHRDAKRLNHIIGASTHVVSDQRIAAEEDHFSLPTALGKSQYQHIKHQGWITVCPIHSGCVK